MTGDKTLPADCRVEPTREVLRRIYMGFGRMSFRHSEDKILRAAHVLADQGWLTSTPPYPCAGEQWTQFHVTSRLDLKALKDL